jgi:hypothetical protein
MGSPGTKHVVAGVLWPSTAGEAANTRTNEREDGWVSASGEIVCAGQSEGQWIRTSNRTRRAQAKEPTTLLCSGGDRRGGDDGVKQSLKGLGGSHGQN